MGAVEAVRQVEAAIDGMVSGRRRQRRALDTPALSALTWFKNREAMHADHRR